MGSLWSVLEEREANLSGRAVTLREQFAGVEQALARLVVACETYQELTCANPECDVPRDLWSRHAWF